MDETIAYFTKLPDEAHWTVAGCGYMRERAPRHQKTDVISRLWCKQREYARFLCETDTDRKTRPVPQKIQFPNKPNPATQASRGHVHLTACPRGHMTHDFLACDAQSECWARDTVSDSTSCWAGDGGRTASGSCAASLTPLPPSFPCSSGWGEVPYTLVCDHRADCSDDSDEQFCVFPPCDGKTEFDCGNGQVR